MVAPLDMNVLFVGSAGSAELREVFERIAKDGAGHVGVEEVEGPVATSIAEAREHLHDAPLGVVVQSEAQVIDALEAGADEVSLASELMLGGVVRFVDRARVRARLRRERTRLAHDLAQAERLASLGTLIAGIAHELNNPLLMITLGIDYLSDAVLPDLAKLREARTLLEGHGELTEDKQARLLADLRSGEFDTEGVLTDLSAATEVAAQLVRDLRVFSRRGAVEEPSLFSPAEVVEQALRLVRREFDHSTIVEQDYAPDLPRLYLPRNRVAQVLTNLLLNASHAMRERKLPTHQLRVSARIDDETLAIFVSDTGPGIAPEALERIFDPFFTTKREGHGTGLGLSISRGIIREMGGDIDASSVFGDGATFVCYLPLPTAEQLEHPPADHSVSEPPQSQAFRPSVLLVDDDERALRATARALGDGYKVIVARDGEEATELLASGSCVDAVISELSLAEVDGPSLHAWIREHRTELANRFLVVTATEHRTQYQEFLAQYGLPVLHKPYRQEALLTALRQVLASKSSEQQVS